MEKKNCGKTEKERQKVKEKREKKIEIERKTGRLTPRVEVTNEEIVKTGIERSSEL